jgi:hypothetical protein
MQMSLIMIETKYLSTYFLQIEQLKPESELGRAESKLGRINRIHSNFDFSNFKSQIRKSNLIEFDLNDQIRLNLTSNFVEFDQI